MGRGEVVPNPSGSPTHHNVAQGPMTRVSDPQCLGLAGDALQRLRNGRRESTGAFCPLWATPPTSPATANDSPETLRGIAMRGAAGAFRAPCTRELYCSAQLSRTPRPVPYLGVWITARLGSPRVEGVPKCQFNLDAVGTLGTLSRTGDGRKQWLGLFLA
jgi:hypothetical protein